MRALCRSSQPVAAACAASGVRGTIKTVSPPTVPTAPALVSCNAALGTPVALCPSLGAAQSRSYSPAFLSVSRPPHPRERSCFAETLEPRPLAFDCRHASGCAQGLSGPGGRDG